MKIFYVTIWISLLSVSTFVYADDFFIYPTQGQSQEQLEKDKFECYSWAKGQTKFDPMALPTASSAPPSQEPKKGGAGKGALLGAAGGAIIGEIAGGHGGEGAAIGAITGGLFGGMRRREQVQQQDAAQQQWEQEQVNQYAAARNAYNRAYVACLEGRGYNVK